MGVLSYDPNKKDVLNGVPWKVGWVTKVIFPLLFLFLLFLFLLIIIFLLFILFIFIY